MQFTYPETEFVPMLTWNGGPVARSGYIHYRVQVKPVGVLLSIDWQMAKRLDAKLMAEVGASARSNTGAA